MITEHSEDEYGTTIDDEQIIQQLKFIIEKLIKYELEYLNNKGYIRQPVDLDVIRDILDTYPGTFTMTPDQVFRRPRTAGEQDEPDEGDTRTIWIDIELYVDGQESDLWCTFYCHVNHDNEIRTVLHSILS